MALPADFLAELRGRTPLAPLIARRVKLERAGRQWKGCCPFHGERTPSFYVWDDHYHCFGCGAHGDAIAFVMQSEGADFRDAVQRLAAEAGLQVPQTTPAAAEAERRRLDLHEVLALASDSFARRLFLPEGRRALDYLLSRGLTEATIRGFGLGWSGPGRGALLADLARVGLDAGRLVAAGLARGDEGEPRPRELFYERVMFPIRDHRGQTISFGGRTLGHTQPKYLNGPETAVFVKRRSLYALDLARAARSRAEIVVVEGYMDAIALHQAGFEGAVAPLGTALAEEQLAVLWRLSPAPILCFDADAAGARAAARAAELALPLLAPDRSLRVAALDPGEDPDSLIRGKGADAFRAVLANARPLDAALFDLVREATGDRTPEQRAELRNRLIQAAARIPDRALASEYRNALLGRYFATRPGRREGAKPPGPAATRPSPSPTTVLAEQGRILTAILLNHPALIRRVDHAYIDAALPPGCDRLRTALLQWAERADTLDSAGLINHLTSSGLDADTAAVLAGSPASLPACALAGAMPEEAEEGWWHFFRLMQRDRLRAELAGLEQELGRSLDAGKERRLVALRRELIALESGEANEPDG